jgi:hypothetical protein
MDGRRGDEGKRDYTEPLSGCVCSSPLRQEHDEEVVAQTSSFLLFESPGIADKRRAGRRKGPGPCVYPRRLHVRESCGTSGDKFRCMGVEAGVRRN